MQISVTKHLSSSTLKQRNVGQPENKILKNNYDHDFLPILIAEENGKIFELHLYVAGTDTTATTLRWALLFMCLHPEKQKRVQQEIDTQIGKFFKDKSKQMQRRYLKHRNGLI